MFSRRIALISIAALGIFTLSARFGEQKIEFSLTDDPIDVIIPAINRSRLEFCIEGLKKNVKNLRNIYVISPKKETDNGIWIDEKMFPFNPESVAKYLFKDEEKAKSYLEKGRQRVGWYLQQLLKLYAAQVIPNISSNILVIDSDTIFLQPTSFMNEKNEPLFCVGMENHKPYFQHAERLLPGFRRVTKYSGICHHMLIQRDIINNLLKDIEQIHSMPAWQAFCSCVAINADGSIPSTGCSEYEIYFNYVMANSNQGHIRPLKWSNVSRKDPLWKNVVTRQELIKYQEKGHVFVSRH